MADNTQSKTKRTYSRKATNDLMRYILNSASPSVETCKNFLENGAHPNNIYDTNPDKMTPLASVASQYRPDLVTLLLEYGADINQKSGQLQETALINAAFHGNEDSVALLLQYGADFELTDKHGWTPLLSAANKGHTAVITRLLDAGANINRTNEDGSTALMFSAYAIHAPALHLLLQRGADINVQHSTGETALMIAAHDGAIDIVKTLIEKGADPALHNENGETAQDMARNMHREELAEILAEAEKMQTIKIFSAAAQKGTTKARKIIRSPQHRAKQP
ncbi:MAG: ankyrin repeat domain-containing protein [Alphaproteobacteria bacterium]|nr:ankyrin repeat domain-containing protein [Alphaproteobacteria bacterium]